MFQHFGNRLKRDLKLLVDRRLDASALASGGVLRVCSLCSLMRRSSYIVLKSSGVEVDVISHKRQRSVLAVLLFFLPAA